MQLRRKIVRMLFFLVLVLLLVQTASALLVGTSSHYDGYTTYSTMWNTKLMTGTIEFAVYDDRNEFESVFSDVGLSAPGAGDFIYAYKIYNDFDSGDMVAYFAILGLDEQASGITGFGALDDDTGGAEPSYSGFEGNDGVWKWSGTDGYRFIQLGDLSWLLVYSSDFDWVKGEYEIRGTEKSDVPMPDGEVPEPTMVALLGAGGAFLFRRKRRANS